MTKGDFLPSDELGEKGESRFKELCADAQLICNKSDRDRAGWDFVVDFPFDPDRSTSFDKRGTPLSCHVQLKTIYNTTRSAKLPLHMAERLAKELKPTFVAVFKVSQRRTVDELYLIHISDDRLAAILKRLRKAELEPDRPLNKQFINFIPRANERLGVDGLELKAAIEKACGPDMHKYSAAKRDQLERLGFDSRPVTMQMTFHAKSAEEMSDILLGLRSLVPVTDMSTQETRFGITLPHLGPTEATVTIQPHPLEHCKLLFKSSDGRPPAVLEADIFIIPRKITGAEPRIHIKAGFVNLNLYPNRKFDSLTIEFDSTGKRASIRLWWNYWRMFHILNQEDGQLEVIGNNSAVLHGLKPIEKFKTRSESYELPMSVCDCALQILRYAGLETSPDLEWDTLEHVAPHLIFLGALIDGNAPKWSYDIAKNPEFQRIDGIPLIIWNHFKMGESLFAYYATTIPRVDNNKLTFADYSLKSIAAIVDTEAAAAYFLESARRREKIENYCQIDPSIQ